MYKTMFDVLNQRLGNSMIHREDIVPVTILAFGFWVILLLTLNSAAI